MALYPEFPQGVLTPGFLDGAGQPQSSQGSPFGSDPLSFAPTDTRGLALPQMEEKRPGLFGRIRQQPGGSRALIALGASLLGNPNFFQGLGNGLLAYQTTLDDEADKLKPQLNKDATFQYQRNPETGELEFKRTAVADFEDSITDRKLQSAQAMSKYRTDTNADLGRSKLEYQDKWSVRDNDTERYKTDRTFEANERDNATALEIARLNREAEERRARITAATNSGKPPPVAALKEFDNYQGKADAAVHALSQGSKIISYLQDGTLDLGIVNNLHGKFSQVTGIGATEGTRAYGELQQWVQSSVNAVLIDANGVQTDGDAERAKIMTLVSAGDNEGAMREIGNIMQMMERGRRANSARAEDIATQYGLRTEATRANAAGRPSAPARKKPSVSNW